MNDLISRLRARTVPQWTHTTGFGSRMNGHKPDALCHEAADELERLRADAERYRWLRLQHTYDGEGDSDIARWFVQAGRDPVPCDPGALDDCIDEAMAAALGVKP